MGLTLYDTVCNHTDDDGYEGSGCSGKAHGKQRCREQLRGKIDAGHTHQHNRNDVVQEGNSGFFAGTEVTAEAEMNAGEKAVPDITAQILTACKDRIAIRGKQGNNRFCNKLDQNGNHNSESGSQINCIAERLLSPFRLIGTDILCTEGRNGRKHRGGNQEQEADNFLYDTNGSSIGESALVGNDRNEDKGNLDQPVLHRNRDADFQNTSHDRGLRFEVCPVQGKSVLFFYKKNKGNSDTDRLGKRRAKSSSGRSQMESSHKDVIQNNIHDAGDGDEIHGTFGVTHTAQNGTDDVICGDKRNSDEADREIRNRSVYRFGRSGHDGYDRFYQQKQYNRQYKGKQQEQGYGISDIRGSLLPVIGTDRLTDTDGCSHGKSDDHNGEHMHDLGADGNGSGTCYTLKLPDDE